MFNAHKQTYHSLIFICFLAIIQIIPFWAYHNVEAHYSITLFSFWNWIYSPIAICVSLGSLGIFAIIAHVTKSPVFPCFRTLLFSALLTFAWVIFLNPYISETFPQLPISVLFVLGAVYVSIALFRVLSYPIWISILLLSLIQYAAIHEGILLNYANLMQVFTASWEDARLYLTLTNIFLLIASLFLSVAAYHLMYRMIRRNTSLVTIGHTGSLLILLFFLCLKPLQGHLAPGRELIWPLGNTAMLSSESARAVIHILRIARVMNAQPPKGTTQAQSTFITPDENIICVLHLGESARADHWSLNGYPRQTTPFLESLETLVSFPDCISSASATDRAFPVMLTNARRDFLNTGLSTSLPNSPPIADFFEACHFTCASFWGRGVLHGSPHSLFTREALYLTRSMIHNVDHDDACPEEQLSQISEFVSSHANKPLFLMINNRGSHAYFDLYDHDNPPFTPVHIPSCNDAPAHNQEDATNFLNAYDNTVHFTDHYIQQLFTQLKGKPFLYVYMSDHGEYLGDGGYWSRGNAPQHVYYKYNACQVPFVIYASPELREKKPEILSSLAVLEKHKNMHTAHEHLFHTLLGLFRIRTPFYDETLDLSSEQAQPYDGPHPGEKEAAHPKQEPLSDTSEGN